MVFLNKEIGGKRNVGEIVCSVVVPLYNEEEVILETYKRLKM